MNETQHRAAIFVVIKFLQDIIKLLFCSRQVFDFHINKIDFSLAKINLFYYTNTRIFIKNQQK